MGEMRRAVGSENEDNKGKKNMKVKWEIEQSKIQIRSIIKVMECFPSKKN